MPKSVLPAMLERTSKNSREVFWIAPHVCSVRLTVVGYFATSIFIGLLGVSLKLL
jgi:hypothetical protein